MAGLKNADDYQNGERFKGGRLLGLVSLVVGLVASLLFFGIAYFGIFEKTVLKNGFEGVVKIGEVGKGVGISILGEGDKQLANYFIPEGSKLAVTDGQKVEKGVKLADLKKGMQRKGMAYSWLFAIVFFLSLGVGGMFWTLLHHASNSGWGIIVRRLMENLGLMIPVLFALSLPIVLVGDFRNSLWEWMPEKSEGMKSAEDYVDGNQADAVNKVDKYFKDAQAKVGKAEKVVEALEKEKASAGELRPGAARQFDDRIGEAQAELDELSKKASKDEKEVRTYLIQKEFKEHHALLHVKRNYLDEAFWLVRFVLYAIVLGGGIFILRAMSLKQDSTGDPRLYIRMQKVSSVILLPFAVAWTFLVVDWLMALDYAWFSTMWGVYLFAGAALNSMALLILIMTGLYKSGYMKGMITKEHYHIMGKLMHAFVIFWAYIAFSQFFLIWYANITEETKFFLIRNTGNWNTYTILFLVIGHFFVPFLVLLIRYHKTTTWIISAVCIWNLVMHLLDIYWIVIPERAVSLTGGAKSYLPEMLKFDILAFIGVGGIFIFCLLKALGSASLYPCRDPRLDESLNLVN